MNNEIQQRLRSACRQVWSRYSEERRQALANARRYHRPMNKNGTLSRKPKALYTCASCNQQHSLKDVQVDHVKPLGATPPFPPDDSKLSWSEWLQRLFCSVDNLQVLCTTCHRDKTASERRKKRVRSIRQKRPKTKRRAKRHLRMA